MVRYGAGFSWIFLGGKCRNCKEKISARYPIVESLNAVLWTLSAYFIGLNANAFIYDALFSALIVMTFIDIDTKEIPNGIVVFIIILSIPLFSRRRTSCGGTVLLARWLSACRFT